MPENSIRYRRLPGTGKSAVHYIRLYEGPDHLLQITTSGYHETYKRFYYRDIQAVVLRKTDRWWLWGLILGVPGVLAVLIGLLLGGGGGILLGLVGTILFFVAGLGFAGGPSCEGFIRTAVQTERLLSVGRLRRARKILARLQPLIAAAQGPLSAEALARPAVVSTAVETPAPPEASSPAAEPPPPSA